MVNKRKRAELSDSDSDEVTPGKQILPVANLPNDFNQEPQDGMQYLFLVRRDARRLPHITRVRNPYEICETEAAHPAASSSTSDRLPCEAWRIVFQTHFTNLRKNLTQATIHVDDDYARRRRVIPEKKDREAWWKFLAGHPESAWRKKPCISRHLRTSNVALSVEAIIPAGTTSLPDARSRDEPVHVLNACPVDLPRNIGKPSSFDAPPSAESTNAVPFAVDFPTSSERDHTEELVPPEVTPYHLREIDHRMSIHLLMYFAHWINIHLQNPSDPLTTISIGHGQWILALLTKVEDQLSADEMNLLRNLARACLGLIHMYRGEHAETNAVSEGVSSSVGFKSTLQMSDVSCWMVFTAIAGYWGQKDLWGDAETTLASA